jgi:polysaccharide export outer membrane protein
LEAVNAAGGLTEDADPGRITIQRNGYIARVDLTGFLERGYRQNNPVLRNGDIVNVPPRRTLEAFLLGEISKPSTVDLSKEPVTLTQALTRQGGLREARADARGVFVFRAAPATTYVYQLETSSPAGLLLGTRFMLEPGDVVYVTRSPLQKWNDTITRILPTVNAVYSVDRIAE